jgi:hypothetical protein
MSRTRGVPDCELDPEIEKTCKQIKKQAKSKKGKEQQTMAENTQPGATSSQEKRIKEYRSTKFTPDNPVQKKAEGADFDVKPSLVNMLQQNARFHGLPSEDPNDHLRKFLRICDSQIIKGVSEETIRLSLFPYSIIDRAEEWYSTLSAGSITSWDDLVTLFLNEYFPPNKSAQLCGEIRAFQQQEDEGLYEAFERFKRMLRKCPNHDIPRWAQVQIFYDGLYDDVKTTMDAASSGGLHNKTGEQAWELIQEMAINARYRSSRTSRNKPRPSGVMNINTDTIISTLSTQLNKRFDELTRSAQVYQIKSVSCEICGGGHPADECPMVATQQNEDVNFVGNQPRQQNNPYSNTYNPGWRQHPNFSWGGQTSGGQTTSTGNQGFQRPSQGGFQNNQGNQGGYQNTYQRTQGNQGFQNGPQGNQNPSKEDTLIKMAQNHDTILQSINTQMGQLVNLMSGRQQGSLPSNTEKNPKEEVHAITLANDSIDGMQHNGSNIRTERMNP